MTRVRLDECRALLDWRWFETFEDFEEAEDCDLNGPYLEEVESSKEEGMLRLDVGLCRCAGFGTDRLHVGRSAFGHDCTSMV